MKFASYAILFLVVLTIHSVTLYVIRWCLCFPSLDGFEFPKIDMPSFTSSDPDGVKSSFSLGQTVKEYQLLTSSFCACLPKDAWSDFLPYLVWFFVSFCSGILIYRFTFGSFNLTSIILIAADIAVSIFLTSYIFKKRNEHPFYEDLYTTEHLQSEFSFPPAREIAYSQQLREFNVAPCDHFTPFTLFFMKKRISYYNETIPKLKMRRSALIVFLTVIIIATFLSWNFFFK